MRPRLAVAFWLLAAPTIAVAEVEVVSSAPEAVSVTIYRDLFALITETRTVDLPAEAHTLAFENVVETVVPASAVVSDLERELLERNYDYDTLAPANLLEKSVGREVVLTRVLPGSGRVVQTRATLVSTAGGVTLRTADGHEVLRCSGLPERLTFEEIPGDLHPTPRLSVRLAAGTPGKRTVKLSYIAHGFAWSSDYVAHLDPDGKTLDLTGWVTLRNLTRATLRQATVQVVAGQLHLLPEEDGGSSIIGASDEYETETERQDARGAALWDLEQELHDTSDLGFLHGCYPLSDGRMRPRALPMFRRSAAMAIEAITAEDIGSLEEVIVTGLRGSLLPPEALADYHLYRVPWPTDLNARQTKQAVFLQKPRVKVERFYGVRLDPDDEEMEFIFDGDSTEPVRPKVLLGLRNEKSWGLGEPLPSGLVRLFERDEGRDIFAGEARLGDKPVGVPFELDVGKAIDLSLVVAVEVDPEDFEEGDAEAMDFRLHVASAKSRPVLLEVRLRPPEVDREISVEQASQRTQRKFGDYMWRLRIPSNGTSALSYRLVGREIGEDPTE